jgi:hypothetical protein
MEATRMRVLGVISTTALLLLLGATVPAFAQEEHQEDKPAQHEDSAKPAAKPEATKPAKQEEQPKTAKQEETKPAKQEAQPNTTKQEETKPAKQEPQQQAKAQQPKTQFARNGQKDSSGHVYNESHFGPSHHARFEANGGRFANGRREYSYGGYWFYAGVYPPWFYQQDVYFIMGADGLWYAVSYSDPSLMFQVNIG